MIKHKKLWMAYSIALLSGLIIGFFLGYLGSDMLRHHFHRRGGPEGFRKFFVEDISARLKLSEAQKGSLEKQADEIFPLIEARRAEGRKQAVEMIDTCIMNISPALDEKQMKVFEEIKEQGRNMLKGRGNRPPPPPPGGF